MTLWLLGDEPPAWLEPLLLVLVVPVVVYALVQTVRALRPTPPRVGDAALPGRAAVVTEGGASGDPVRVRLLGELWEARCSEPLQAGDRVVVTAVDGLLLTVRRSPNG